ncbi:DNA polymerase III subunit epsilon [Salmonella enterica subsp. houtenae serovar Houten]|nr:DNA polymerase III subunit epsilon [Salmonella enterica subsp. houtenae serovar Houten]SUF51061.1 DNA polymerase III subunit epsilon [Salmonella enterica]VEA90859.1 DNA polymerase III subunit epsilon [Salmonella enterica subsp. houtenae]VFS03011.1 DNA polymerase III subunit epsilon [Salmonella enterica subsp. houtenae]VUD24947.1 DNA polymerase III subunit epsilon [Salmonella sp. NCTC 7297]
MSLMKRKCFVCWVSDMEKEQLITIANTLMPFGKYQGRRLIDLPEEYLLWFARKDQFPAGKLGELMQITLLIKTEGLTQLVQPLKRPL